MRKLWWKLFGYPELYVVEDNLTAMYNVEKEFLYLVGKPSHYYKPKIRRMTPQEIEKYCT